MSTPTIKVILPIIVLAFAFVVNAPLSAQGGGGSGPTGTIYFSHLGGTWTMNPDDSNKTPLPAGVSGEPSRFLHGGRRWFLQVRDIPGETYPGQSQWPTRREIFAIRDDGNPAYTVQLTTEPDLETNATCVGSRAMD